MEMDCFANWPRSLFKLRSKRYEDIVDSSDAAYDASQVGEGQIQNKVTLTQVTVQNIFYAMNSLIAVHQAGATVQIN